MSLRETPLANRFTIGIFGRRNSGKSSLINAITGQNIALTSEIAGTTTDPVFKTMEMLPLGPILLIDTAGLDDEGYLGVKRVEKSYEALRKCDMVIFVCDATQGENCFRHQEKAFLSQLRERHIVCLIALNKCGNLPEVVQQIHGATSLRGLAQELDLNNSIPDESFAKHFEKRKRNLEKATEIRHLASKIGRQANVPVICTDASYHIGIDALKEAIIQNAKHEEEEVGLTDGLVNSKQIVILVTPIDRSAPKGRLILPQQQVIRDILDKDGIAFITKETELEQTLSSLACPPDIVITDSQVFHFVNRIVPKEIPLTSFSILFARQKGDLKRQVQNLQVLAHLKPHDRILIAEGCTHHRQSDDIGTVKIPAMIRKIEPTISFDWKSGAVFPPDVSSYKLIIHCGACMLNRREMMFRVSQAEKQGVPVVNYGLVIAYCNNILDRVIAPFGLTV